jgi:Fur family iron response transcriptional regulator
MRARLSLTTFAPWTTVAGVRSESELQIPGSAISLRNAGRTTTVKNKFADQNEEAGADEIRNLLSEAGLLPTRQRIAVVSLLRRKDDKHVSAEGLYEELAASGIKCSLSSVYRLLRELNENGLLKRMPLYGATAFFDTELAPHHHFYAVEEDRLIDVSEQQISVSGIPSPPDGYELVSVDLLLRIRRRDKVEF